MQGWQELESGEKKYTMQRLISVHCHAVSWHRYSSKTSHYLGVNRCLVDEETEPSSFASVNCFEVRALHCRVGFSLSFISAGGEKFSWWGHVLIVSEVCLSQRNTPQSVIVIILISPPSHEWGEWERERACLFQQSSVCTAPVFITHCIMTESRLYHLHSCMCSVKLWLSRVQHGPVFLSYTCK